MWSHVLYINRFITSVQISYLVNKNPLGILNCATPLLQPLEYCFLIEIAFNLIFKVKILHILQFLIVLSNLPPAHFIFCWNCITPGNRNFLYGFLTTMGQNSFFLFRSTKLGKLFFSLWIGRFECFWTISGSSYCQCADFLQTLFS